MSQGISLVWHNFDGMRGGGGASGRRGSTACRTQRNPRRQSAPPPVLRTEYCVHSKPSDARKQPDAGATLPPSLGGNRAPGQQGQPGGKRKENTDQTARRARTGRAQPESPKNSTVAFIRANQSPHGKLAASQHQRGLPGGGVCCWETGRTGTGRD